MPKKIPLRQCVGCRTMRPKQELLRLVHGPDGSISLDTKGKAQGRGTYICPDPTCLKKARKARALERAFESAVPSALYDTLEAELINRVETIEEK